ncbi:MAG: heterodisulfide reductase-related iron-sulfur binding cluster [Bryobacter sp.]|nr:heterodisulfide reductase-related iron-sulfur binding cluster [Bryobacter sp.]
MVNPSWFERGIFLLLLALSGAVFWRRFGPVVAKIRAAKPDADFSLHPLGKRAWEFVSEVLLQSKVIRERPLPGLAHALVFWGFCAFALVTVDHLLRGFGLSLLDREGTFGGFYFALAMLFAIAVSISIAGLFFRRFVVRPKWLGEKVSVESGVIAGLIFTLMVTYLADYWGHDLAGLGRVNWWVHTLALLVFLPLIPHTKHLHLILSPATVFLSRGCFSRIPPLAGDEDFGMVTGKDVTQLTALQAFSCVECGRCTEHCPAANTGKELNPKMIALGFRAYLNEAGPASEQPLLGAHLSQEAAFQCTTCGACEYQCPVGIEHLPMIVGLRRGATNTGAWEDGYGGKLFLNLEKYGNPLGLSQSERDKFIQKNALPVFDGSQQYLLWLGCMGSYDPQGREIVLSLVRVLRHLGISFGVLKKEKCTGDSARRLGNDLAFGELAQFNLEQIQAAKPAKILSICPHCVRTMTEDWKEFGAALEVEHHSEFLERHLVQLPFAEGKDRVVFHDPCYLGRYRGTYDEPRDVAARMGRVLEPERSRERSFCCGAGGGLVFLGEEKGDRVSETRARELAATGASVVAAACPFCNTMFRDALVQVAGAEKAPKLMDIAQIAAASLPQPESTIN